MIPEAEKELWGCRDASRIAAYFAQNPQGWHFGFSQEQFTRIAADANSLWAAMDRLTQDMAPATTFEWVRGFLQEASRSLYAFKRAKVLPIREHRKNYAGIAAHAQALIDAIEGDDELEDLDLFTLFPVEEIHGRLKASIERGGVNGSVPEAEVPNVRNVARSFHMASMAMARIYEASPSLTDALRWIVAQAEEVTRAGPLDTRPGNKAVACRRYVVRRLSRWLRITVGEPLHGELADAVNALFPELEAVDAIYIQKTARPPETSV